MSRRPLQIYTSLWLRYLLMAVIRFNIANLMISAGITLLLVFILVNLLHSLSKGLRTRASKLHRFRINFDTASSVTHLTLFIGRQSGFHKTRCLHFADID
jgi:hypothetical protein